MSHLACGGKARIARTGERLVQPPRAQTAAIAVAMARICAAGEATPQTARVRR